MSDKKEEKKEKQKKGIEKRKTKRAGDHKEIFAYHKDGTEIFGCTCQDEGMKCKEGICPCIIAGERCAGECACGDRHPAEMCENDQDWGKHH